jgi:hypothetical protein
LIGCAKGEKIFLLKLPLYIRFSVRWNHSMISSTGMPTSLKMRNSARLHKRTWPIFERNHIFSIQYKHKANSK